MKSTYYQSSIICGANNHHFDFQLLTLARLRDTLKQKKTGFGLSVKTRTE